MEKIFGRPASLADFPYPYCPGCGHGIVQRLVGEAMDSLGIAGKAWSIEISQLEPQANSRL